MHKPTRVDFRLKQIMEDRGIKGYSAIKQMTGVPVSTLCDLVKRRRVMPHPDTLVALCDGLDVTAGDLIVVTPCEK
jgi:DNA-binding Xre family transcriptional regulator